MSAALSRALQRARGHRQLCIPRRRSDPWRGGDREDLVRSVLRRGAQPERQLVGPADRSRRRQLPSEQVAVDVLLDARALGVRGVTPSVEAEEPCVGQLVAQRQGALIPGGGVEEVAY